MIFKTENGAISINLEDVAIADYRKNEYNNKVNHELGLLVRSGGFYHVAHMDTEEDALKVVSIIDKKNAETETENLFSSNALVGRVEMAEKPKTYIDGFKDGCEYTLMLKDSHE